MRVLVTGGCGFIGSHLVRRLGGDGHWVEVLDDLSGVGSGQRLPEGPLNEDTVENWSCGDGFLENKYDAILHLAAVSRTVPAIEEPWECMYTNAMGTVGVLEVARVMKIPRVVVSSSNVVYAADTPYKASKLMAEEACKAYHETYGVSVVCLRYSNVYGSGFAKGDPACLAAMRDSLVDKGYLEITGDGEQTRDFTHVSDIVEGNLAAARSEYCGTVDLCTGVNWTMNRAACELVSTWARSEQKLSSHVFRYIGDRRGDCKHIVQDPGPAREILGWEARVKFEEGVKDVWTF
jgi:nucleoside-diphosphate-sugar epimerase